MGLVNKILNTTEWFTSFLSQWWSALPVWLQEVIKCTALSMIGAIIFLFGSLKEIYSLGGVIFIGFIHGCGLYAIFLVIKLLNAQLKNLKITKLLYDENIKQNLTKVDELIAELHNSNDTMNILWQIGSYSRNFPSQLIDKVTLIAKQYFENPTSNHKSIIHTMLRYDPYQIEISVLLNDILIKLQQDEKKQISPSISKQTVEFLISITDNELDILKKQFKYAIDSFSHNEEYVDIAIYQSNNIQDKLIKDGTYNIISCLMKFDGNIWSKNDVASYLIPKIVTHDQFEYIVNINKSNKILKINGHKNNLINNDRLTITNAIAMKAFACLTDIGLEIYNILKDKNKIDNIPNDYLQGLIEYNQIIYPLLKFELHDNT